MSKKKVKSSVSKKSVAHYFKGKISLVIPCYNESKRINHLLKTLKSFDGSWDLPLEIIIVDDGSSDETAQQIEQNFTNAFSDKVEFHLVKLGKNQGKGGALKAGVEKAQGDFILTMDADNATHPGELKKWLASLPGKTFQEDEILIGSREHQNSNVKGNALRRLAGLIFNFVIQLFTNLYISDTQCGFKLYPTSIAKKLFGSLKTNGWAHDVELLYSAKMNGYKIKSLPVKWIEQEDSKISLVSDSIKMTFETIRISILLNWRYFISTPFRELKNKAWSKNDPSYYRLGFTLLATLLFFMMPMLSFDYGITGDEEVQKIYGEKLLAYYETDGQDKSALEYQNLYYYGGLFDYSCAWINKHIGGIDVYDMRHLLNAFVGFLLMLFTGLVAKELSGSWRTAFFALLFIVLSPRIFGHSMNNPKDIPFAAAYVFTLLYIIRFIRQLPHPSSKTVLMLIIGIAASINVRVGGILLIAYLGLFIAMTYLIKKDLRSQIFNLKETGKVAVIGIFVALAGYLGGLLYWPYGAQKPFTNPFESLREMSNFSTSIRMLFDGEHLWSDELPWYYIPKWISISAPIFMLLGLVLFLGFFFRKMNVNERLSLMFVAFTGIFPVAYAIFKGSLLYDGMRHFLFVVPVLAVLAAWGWHHIVKMKSPVNYVGSVALIILLALPAFWMFKNHPYQYIYFNELSGGPNNAYAKYETDYWMTSVKKMSAWLVANDDRIKNGEEIRVFTNCHKPVKHYMKNMAPNVFVGYARFNDRHKFDTDYYMYISRFVDRELMQNGVWPAPEVIYEEKVDNCTVGVLSKRIGIKDHEAAKAEKEKNFQEAASLYEQASVENPKNEQALLGMIRSNLNLNNLPKIKEALDKLAVLSTNLSDYHYYKGVYHMNSGDLANAKTAFIEAIDRNYKYSPSYYYLASIYQRENNPSEALKTLEGFDNAGGTIPTAYDQGAQLSTQLGNQALALYFQSKKAYVQKDYQKSLNLLQESLRLNKNYQPAIELNEVYQKAMAK